jgi:hypothetical protein
MCQVLFCQIVTTNSRTSRRESKYAIATGGNESLKSQYLQSEHITNKFIHYITNAPGDLNGLWFTLKSSSSSSLSEREGREGAWPEEEGAWPAWPARPACTSTSSSSASSASTQTPAASPHSTLGPGKPLRCCMRNTMPLQHTAFLSMATQLRPVMAQATIEVPEKNQITEKVDHNMYQRYM